MAINQGPVLSKGDRIYLAGPFTPYTDANGHLVTTEENIFRARAMYRELRALGFMVFSPHLAIMDPAENGITDPGEVWRVAMAECLTWLALTDATVMMPDWEYSRGARKEYQETVFDGRAVFETMDKAREALARSEAAS